MLQLAVLQTGRAFAAGVSICPVRAGNVLRQCYSQRQLAYARSTRQQQSMGYTPLLHTAAHFLLDRMLTYDILE